MEKKAAGVKLGRRSTLPPAVAERIVAAHQAGQTLAAIARGLEEDGVATGQGGARWYPASVRAVLVSQGHAPRAGTAPKPGLTPAGDRRHAVRRSHATRSLDPEDLEALACRRW